jgi:hypothetical protein
MELLGFFKIKNHRIFSTIFSFFWLKISRFLEDLGRLFVVFLFWNHHISLIGSNHEIGINVQTRYLRFKNMSYESKNYLCDINCVQTRYLRFKNMSYESKNYLCDISCVQLRKTLTRCQCGNTQLEVVLSVCKGVPYAERLCRGCDLGKIEDEEHLLLVNPNTQKVKECFCSTLPLTHTSILVEFMQTTNTVALAKFVACCQYKRTICPPWSTFRLMDSLVPNGLKIIK